MFHLVTSAIVCSPESVAPEGIKIAAGQLKITNWQSAISWRRGWDLNPRWSFPHSGFRDRCTKPLCDLSERKTTGRRGRADTGKHHRCLRIAASVVHPSAFILVLHLAARERIPALALDTLAPISQR